MAGGGCVKKFRNCEVAALMAGLEIQMEAFHQAQRDGEVSEARHWEAVEIDADLSKALRKAWDRYIRLGDRIGADLDQAAEGP